MCAREKKKKKGERSSFIFFFFVGQLKALWLMASGLLSMFGRVIGCVFRYGIACVRARVCARWFVLLPIVPCANTRR